MNVLVTGGAGYIGSHTVHALCERGDRVVVIDSLLSGRREAVDKRAQFVEADVRDRTRVSEALKAHRIDAIVHFAARIQVGESVRDPRLYYTGNTGATIELWESALDAGVKNVVFSSTAAVYGNPERVPIDETHPTNPINPYGATKLAVEQMLASYASAYGLRYAALRYFNAAGANWRVGLGETHEPETHLIPLVVQAALGVRPHLDIFGDDYETPDGTCVRDYIHVTDLAAAHVAALDHLSKGGESGAFNLGTGNGHSVREIITATERVAGRPVPIRVAKRRPGDPPVLVASPARAARVFAWKAQHSLEQIVSDAWEWGRVWLRK